MKIKFLALAMMILSACRQEPGEVNIVAVDNLAAPSTTDAPAKDGSKQIVAEPKGPIDPKSTVAAGQVVQSYGALIEQSRFNEAASTWGNQASAEAFAKELQSRGLKHLEIGDLGDPEGAAGSVYVTMPVVFYQGTKRSSAIITLRRVNDVDGATEAQRRWHIERIEWSNA